VAVTEFMDFTWYVTDCLHCRVVNSFQGLCYLRTRTCSPRTRTRTCKLVLSDFWVQGLSSRTTTLIIITKHLSFIIYLFICHSLVCIVLCNMHVLSCRRQLFLTVRSKPSFIHVARLLTPMYYFLRKSNQASCQQISKNVSVEKITSVVKLISMY